VRARDVADDWVGELKLAPDGRPAEYHALRLESRTPEGAIFAAKIPGGAVDFGYRARLRDGRSRTTARIDYEPRPVAQKLEATLVLPA
jgi:hypothetical protein